MLLPCENCIKNNTLNFFKNTSLAIRNCVELSNEFKNCLTNRKNSRSLYRNENNQQNPNQHQPTSPRQSSQRI